MVRLRVRPHGRPCAAGTLLARHRFAPPRLRPACRHCRRYPQRVRQHATAAEGGRSDRRGRVAIRCGVEGGATAERETGEDGKLLRPDARPPVDRRFLQGSARSGSRFLQGAERGVPPPCGCGLRGDPDRGAVPAQHRRRRRRGAVCGLHRGVQRRGCGPARQDRGLVPHLLGQSVRPAPRAAAVLQADAVASRAARCRCRHRGGDGEQRRRDRRRRGGA